jgi:hypothetical protein
VIIHHDGYGVEAEIARTSDAYLVGVKSIRVMFRNHAVADKALDASSSLRLPRPNFSTKSRR